MSIFLIEPDEDVCVANFLVRGGWSTLALAPAWMPTQARAKWLYAQWLAGPSDRYGIPVVQPRPWQTLAGRLLRAALNTAQG